MSIFSRFLNRSPTKQTLRMIEMNGDSFYMWNGDAYQSDFVVACLRPYVNAIGKLTPKHIQKSIKDGVKLQEWPFIRKLLDNPNPYTTGQELQECIASSLKLNNNAFVRVIRDINGTPCELTYVPAILAETKYYGSELYIRFNLSNGRMEEYRYDDLIHIKNMSKNGEIFGQSNATALNNLLNVISMTDQSIVKAIKNGGVIRWLLKFLTTMRQEDIKQKTNDFAEQFMNVKNATGVAGIDNKMDAQQISPNDYVPVPASIEKVIQRLYSFFGTNEKIVQSKYNEDEWNAYYESEIEPVVMKLSNAYTNRLFSDGQQKFNNKIVFESASLQYASMSTKLNLSQMVDRGAMTPNEWREVLNLVPIEGGDKPLRRLDTTVVGKGKEDNNEGPKD